VPLYVSIPKQTKACKDELKTLFTRDGDERHYIAIWRTNKRKGTGEGGDKQRPTINNEKEDQKMALINVII